jgi:uncharacterized cofD-like protein
VSKESGDGPISQIHPKQKRDAIGVCLDKLLARQLTPLDLLPHTDLREKLVELTLSGEPPGLDAETASQFQHLRLALEEKAVEDVRVVVFGGGTGLSNLIGGDSRRPVWTRKPFVGLKEIFPQTRAIVCVTDDGGSSGELQKDLPLIALGDLRHVLLSSIQSVRLQALYGLNLTQAGDVVAALASLFNYRFTSRPVSAAFLLAQPELVLHCLPSSLQTTLIHLIELLFTDPHLRPTLSRPHCLGNLILAAALFAKIPPSSNHFDSACRPELPADAMIQALGSLASCLGAGEMAVLPCTTTQALLSVLYSNGVEVMGEYKSGYAQRGYPVDHVFVEFCEKPHVPPEVFSAIDQADILVLAPGSLYSSLIPIFQIPGLADAVRKNRRALKILVSNLWVQAGETDRSLGDVERKFHISDLLRAYDRNIPGGTKGLFDEILSLSLKDVPASVLQRYAVEGKVPIYLDRDKVCAQGFIPIECGIFSRVALAEQGVIQHGPVHLAKVIKTLWAVFDHFQEKAPTSAIEKQDGEQSPVTDQVVPNDLFNHSPELVLSPCLRYRQIARRLAELSTACSQIRVVGAMDGAGNADRFVAPVTTATILRMVENILWRHPDIPLSHLDSVRGIVCIEQDLWRRCQKWDSVFSFYDPEDGLIKIRQDQLEQEHSFEVAFLVALGQSLLGNYFRHKEMRPLRVDSITLGKVYHLFLRSPEERICWFSDAELRTYLELSRMLPVAEAPDHFTRVINGDEGFTPPGLLMGLNYAWYLDNRFASHVEYKMAVMKVAPSGLIPEQRKMLGRRKRLVSFFRGVVFRKLPRGLLASTPSGDEAILP